MITMYVCESCHRMQDDDEVERKHELEGDGIHTAINKWLHCRYCGSDQIEEAEPEVCLRIAKQALRNLAESLPDGHATEAGLLAGLLDQVEDTM